MRSKEAIKKILVDENEATKMLCLCPKTVYSLRKAGKLPFVQLGRAIRYRVESLLDFIKQLETRVGEM